MQIKFNVEIETSNEIDDMNFDEVNEYLCRMVELENYFHAECMYCRRRIEEIRGNFELPF